MEEEESVLTIVRLKADSSAVKRLDFFVYEGDGLHQLEKHLRYDSFTDNLGLKTSPGEKIVVAVAGSPKDFNLTALSKFESFDLVSYAFSEDSAEYPVMSGYATTVGNVCEVSLTPLMSSVEIESISSELEDYENAESPRVRLKEINKSAALMQQSGFHPTETIEYGVWKELPYDIGLFTQHPGVKLFCYPNDTPETTLGTPHTSLELECTIAGQKCSYELALPPIGRNEAVKVSIIIKSAAEARLETR